MTPRILIALYDYNARENSDMSFRKGDRMELLDDRFVFSLLMKGMFSKAFYCFSDSDWWKAQHMGNNKVGYIPRNFVAMEQSVESYE